MSTEKSSATKSLRSESNDLPPANAHPMRPAAGATSDPDVILAILPIGTPDYLRVLGAIPDLALGVSGLCGREIKRPLAGCCETTTREREVA
jgi:hypothetical protein